MSPNAVPDTDRLAEQVRHAARAAGLAEQAVAAALQARDYCAVLEELVPRRGGLPPERVRAVQEPVEALLRAKLYAHPGARGAVPPVVLGTAGHRGELGTGLTLVHVQAILEALFDMIEGFAPAERRRHFGAEDVAGVKAMGFVIGHDNRLFNPELSFYAAHLLERAGYRAAYAGRVSTPELSRVVPAAGWAGAVNFTPSHNPFRYGGMKINPADGGLAGNDLTDPLEARANERLQRLAPAGWPGYGELAGAIRAAGERVERTDVHRVYLECLEAHPVVRLGELCRTLRELPAGERLLWVADPTWGAAVPVYRRLQERVGADVLRLIHTEEDPYFGGQSTEPNPQTLADALDALRDAPARHKVAIRNDPDADRGLVGDDEGGAMKMNRFAVLVMRYLMDLGRQGDVVTTVPTSHMGPDYARAHGCRVHLTPTGFKNFRPFLTEGRAMVAYEESDGISIAGHSLDKDGVLAGLLAVRMVLHYRRSLSALLAEVERETGRYHWEQMTFFIDMSAREAKARLGRLAGYRPGAVIPCDGGERTIGEVDSRDGYKFIFRDGSWLMMRPSGTEPKVRVYAETRDSGEATRALCEAGKALAMEAIRQG